MTANPTALVTGGAGSLGRAIVQRLSKDREVMVLDADEARLERFRGEAPPGVVAWLHADILDVADVQRVVTAATESSGPPLILINCAGIGPVYRPALQVEESAILRAMQVNVIGAMNVCRSVVPAMRAQEWGRIINISSVTARGGWPRRAEYAASKAALESMSATLAVELGGFGITVNCIAPGHMRTELTEGSAIPWDAITQGTALRRLVTPEEVAETAAHLASNCAGGTTGTVLTVDAGFLANKLSSEVTGGEA